MKLLGPTLCGALVDLHLRHSNAALFEQAVDEALRVRAAVDGAQMPADFQVDVGLNENRYPTGARELRQHGPVTMAGRVATIRK